MAKGLWVLAYFAVEPFTSLAFWLAQKLHSVEIFIAAKAGEHLDADE